MTKKGKIWMILFLAMTLGVLFQTAPECQARVYSGKCKSNLTWYYNTKTKTITIDCKGEMPDDEEYRGLSMGWLKYYTDAKKVVIRKGITSIGFGAFEGFYKLEEVVLPEGLREIKTWAFNGCSRLRKINFPSSLKKIGKDVFSDTKIEKVTIKGYKKIGEGSFESAQIKEAYISKDVKVGSFLFCGCKSLKKVTLEKGVKKISDGLFSKAGLEKVTIPSSVEEIEDGAFFSFSQEEATLKKVTIRSKKIKKWGKDIFGKAHKDLVIYVPREKKEEYTKALRDGGLPDYVKVVGKTWGKKKKAAKNRGVTR